MSSSGSGGIGAMLVSARSFEEYTAMFALTDADLTGLVLDCPGGASGFTAGAAARGMDAVAVDPTYTGGPQALAAVGAQALEEVERGSAFTAANSHRFVWTWFTDPGDHARQRTASAQAFAADAASHPERYVGASLPHLPFPDASFDLVLSSHLLFTYGDRFDDAFHLAALVELARVARAQVRIFPLLSHVDGRPHPGLGALRACLADRGITSRVESSAGYEFQVGGDEVLVLRVRAQRPDLAQGLEEVVLEPVEMEDAGELWTLQRAAYASEAQLHDDPHLPPLVQTLAQLRTELAGRSAVKAVARFPPGRIIGSVQAHTQDGMLHVARLAVAPDWQGRGVGSRLLAAIEASAGPAVREATLFTGVRSTANLAMYARRGYAVTPTSNPEEGGTGVVHLTKVLPLSESLVRFQNFHQAGRGGLHH